MHGCCICLLPTLLPYACRACWSALPLAVKQEFYRRTDRGQHVQAEQWLRRKAAA